MREGELLALTLNDFDFDNNTVSITKNYARLGHENIETTLNTYSHLYPNKHGEVAEILSKLIQN